MEKHKGLEEIKEQLIEFEQDILVNITSELVRIDRAVSMDEFHYALFSVAVTEYLKTIRLDEDREPVLDTEFGDIREKHLSSFISDGEIGHWGLIGLLELLIKIDK